VRRSNERCIDLIRINGRYMATNGGLGLGASVALQVNEWRAQAPLFKRFMKLTGPNIYSAGVVLKLLGPGGRGIPFRIDVDGVVSEIRTPILMINNQPVLGGNFAIAPSTRNDDGTFNVAGFGHRHRLGFLKGLLDIRRGRDPRNDPEFFTAEARRVRIDVLDGQTLPFFGDGEFLCEASSFDIEIMPKGLRLFSPLGEAL